MKRIGKLFNKNLLVNGNIDNTLKFGNQYGIKYNDGNIIITKRGNDGSIEIISRGDGGGEEPEFPPDNEIWYTTTTGTSLGYSEYIEQLAEELEYTYKGPRIISDTYKNGKGIIKFAGPVITLGIDDNMALLYPCFYFNENNYLICSLELPKSITTLYVDTITNTSNLNVIISHAKIQPAILGENFKGLPNTGIIKVPTGSDYSTWQSSIEGNWGIIFPLGTPPDNEIWYRLSSNSPSNTINYSEYLRANVEDRGYESLTYVGPTLISDTYEDGKGVLRFAGPITTLGIGKGIVPETGEEILSDLYPTFSCAQMGYSYMSYLEQLSLPNSVTTLNYESIQGYEFYDWKELSLGNSVKFIEMYAVAYFNGPSFKLPNTFVSVGSKGLTDCEGIRTLVFSDSIASIDNRAFNQLWNLISVIFNKKTPPDIGSDTFSTTNLTYIWVPSQSVEAYKTAPGFEQYADKIQAIPE